MIRSLRGFAVGTLLSLVLASPGVAEDFDADAALQAGIAAYDAGDYAGAHQAWLPLAEREDAAGLRNLGHLYRLGLGVEADATKAADFYRGAARQGLSGAQANLGVMYLKGMGIAQSDDLAAYWFDAAARQGHALSQYNLALLYEQGRGVAQDLNRALGWLYLASRSGHEAALARLGALTQTLPGPSTQGGEPDEPAISDDGDDPMISFKVRQEDDFPDDK